MSAGSDISSRVLAFILAGGRGERLHPLTRRRPKPLVCFGSGHRLIDFTLLNCLNAGLARIRVLTQQQGPMIDDYVRTHISQMNGRHSWHPDRVRCLMPQPGNIYQGTADAVYQNLACLDETRPDYVIILSSDHVYRMDYRKLIRFHINAGAEFTMAATECPATDAVQFGVLDTDAHGRAIHFQEKPAAPRPMKSNPERCLVNMGVYVFNTAALQRVLEEDATAFSSHDFGHDLIPALVKRKQASVYNFNHVEPGAFWSDVGTPDNYYRSHMELLGTGAHGRIQMECLMGGLDRGVLVESSGGLHRSILADAAVIGAETHIRHSIVSSRVRLGRQVSIEDSILMPGVRVGDGARIRHAIIDENVSIPAGMQIGYNVMQDHRSGVITEGGVIVVSEESRLEHRSRIERTVVPVRSGERAKSHRARS